jgi:hypothetical protein
MQDKQQATAGRSKSRIFAAIDKEQGQEEMHCET